jgi:uncharacterized protein
LAVRAGIGKVMTDFSAIEERLDRLLEALERLAPPAAAPPDFAAAEAFLWEAERRRLRPIARVNRVDLSLLRGIDQVRDILLDNTRRFAGGLPANNALLWGARGMGKSSLVKAVHAAIGGGLKLIEIHREDIHALPSVMELIRNDDHRFVLFCDDLTFEATDLAYKSLKAALEGGIDGRPDNAIFYATSNRRHLIPREMMENEASSAVAPHEVVDEKVSLSDRFGLWLGFHACSQDDYLAMVRGYADALGLDIDDARLVSEALEWAATRGARSGRVAWQFSLDLAGRLGVRLADQSAPA